MRKIIVAICVTLLVPLCIVRADARVVCKAGEVHLSNQKLSGALAGIEIGEECQLFIDAGTDVTMLPDAEIVILGSMVVSGDERAPVTIHGENNQIWRGIHAIETARIEWNFLDLSQMRDGVTIETDAFTAQDISLIDSIDSRIKVGKRDENFTSLKLKNLRFDIQYGQDPTAMGLQVFGNWREISIDTIQIQTQKTFAFDPSVEVIGGYNTIAINRFSQFGCLGETREQRIDYFLFAKQSFCKPQNIPVIFVPGFGGSINLSALTSTDQNIEAKGWKFYEAITPSYTSFTGALKNSGIRYEIAYYDWRLPPDEASRNFLEPLLKEVKKKYGVPKVHLVAHSYGGIVARKYIQGSRYLEDVASLIELGTPNLGAVKAYPPWVAGAIPEDWQSLTALLRLYQRDTPGSDKDTVRKFFRSVQSLQPIYPAIQREGLFLSSQELVTQNTDLLDLQARAHTLFMRTKVFSFASVLEKTPKTFFLEITRGETIWEDGLPAKPQEELQNIGDTTVPRSSALLAGATGILVSGEHQSLPETAQKGIFELLYPTTELVPKKPLNSLDRSAKNMLWFFFDCPVEVSITNSVGEVVTSKEEVSSGEFAVVKSEAMIWMVLPRMTGEYSISVTALENTDVRSWVNQDVLQEYFLKKGETKNLSYQSVAQPSEVLEEALYRGYSFIDAYERYELKYEDKSYYKYEYFPKSFDTQKTSEVSQTLIYPIVLLLCITATFLYALWRLRK